MAVSVSNASNAILEALLALVRAQMVPGGKLATLASVVRGKEFATELVPAMAIDFEKWSATWYASRTRRVVMTFKIYLAVSSVDTATRQANLSDARAAIATLIDDGNGNGFEPLIGDVGTFGLGGLAQETALTGGENYENVKVGPDQSVWAYRVWTYEAIVMVRS